MWKRLGLEHIENIFRDKHMNIETYEGDQLVLKTSLYLDGDIITQTQSLQISPTLLAKHQQNLHIAETTIQQNIKRALNLVRIVIFTFAILIAIALGRINDVGDEIFNAIAWNAFHLLIGGVISWLGGKIIEKIIRVKLKKLPS